MIELQSRHVEICDAVVDVLNAAELSQVFTAQRFEDAGAALDKLAENHGPGDPPRVAVIPQAARRKSITRGGAVQLEFDVSLAVLAKIDPRDSRDQIDALERLMQELIEEIENEPLDELRPPKQTDTKLPAPFAPELLREKHLFLAPATLTFRQYANR